MSEFTIPAPEKISNALERLIQMGELIDKGGRVSFKLQAHQIAKIKGIKVEIFSNEHPPPHFRVKLQDSTANFRISDGELLNGSGEILRHKATIYKWWALYKSDLIDAWNKYRPSDCPVGVYQP